MILLTAIIDRPAETIKLQRQYDVTPSEASTLVLALRPRWDRLIEQTGEDMESWTPEHMRDVLLCRKSCDCHFYLEVLEKRPQLKKKMTPRNLKTLERRAAQKNKGDELKCLERETGARRALIEELKEEAPDYGAESVY